MYTVYEYMINIWNKVKTRKVLLTLFLSWHWKHLINKLINFNVTTILYSTYIPTAICLVTGILPAYKCFLVEPISQFFAIMLLTYPGIKITVKSGRTLYSPCLQTYLLRHSTFDTWRTVVLRRGIVIYSQGFVEKLFPFSNRFTLRSSWVSIWYTQLILHSHTLKLTILITSLLRNYC